MVLRNPTDSTVSIQLDGTVYSIAPQGVSKELPESVVSRWKKAHEFLREEEGTEEVKKEEIVETSEEIVNEPIVVPAKAKKESTFSQIARTVRGKK